MRCGKFILVGCVVSAVQNTEYFDLKLTLLCLAESADDTRGAGPPARLPRRQWTSMHAAHDPLPSCCEPPELPQGPLPGVPAGA